MPAAIHRSRIAVVLRFGAAAAWIAIAVCVATIVAGAFVDGRSLGELRGWIAAAGVLAVARGVAEAASERIAQTGGGILRRDLRARIGAAVLAVGPIRIRGERSGELVYALSEGVDALETWLVRFRPARLLAIAVPLLVACVVAVVDPWSVLVLLFAGPVLVAILGLIGRRVRVLSERREREIAWLHGHVLDLVRGIGTLRAFGRAADQAEVLEDVSRRAASSSMAVLRVAFQSTLVLEWGATAATAMVAIETSVRVMAGELAFGPALVVLLLTPEFFLPLRRLSAEYHAGSAGDAAAGRIAEILARPEPTAGGGRPESARAADPVPPAPPAIAFSEVSVTYGGSRAALTGCSLSVAAGERVALVGETGAGKSTVAAVLLRFVDPDRGSVTVDGAPLAGWDAEAWRRRVAWVPQHPTVFRGTVADNLRLGAPDATDDEVRAAAASVGADGLFRALPGGYATMLGAGGVRLSGGERQLLAFARAALRDADLVILDEATSHLDDDAHATVLAGLPTLLEGRTAIVIAHRLEILPVVDRALVMERGRVVDAAPPGEPASSVVLVGDGGP